MNQKKFLRLYKSHDTDLISILLSEQVNLSRLTKACLKMYAAGEDGYIKLPNITVTDIDKNGYTCTYYLNDEKDKDIIKLLKNVDKYKENAFIKCVIREKLFPGFASLYLPSSVREEYISNQITQPVYRYDATEMLAIGKSENLDKKHLSKIDMGLMASRKATDEENDKIKEIVTDLSENDNINKKKNQTNQDRKKTKQTLELFSESEKNVMEENDDEDDPFGSSSTLIPGFKIPVQTF